MKTTAVVREQIVCSAPFWLSVWVMGRKTAPLINTESKFMREAMCWIFLRKCPINCLICSFAALGKDLGWGEKFRSFLF